MLAEAGYLAKGGRDGSLDLVRFSDNVPWPWAQDYYAQRSCIPLGYRSFGGTGSLCAINNQPLIQKLQELETKNLLEVHKYSISYS